MQFIVDPLLLEKAYAGDGEAQYQIGVQALSEGRLGFAITFFELARKRHHPFAKNGQRLAERALFDGEMVS